MTRSQSDRDLQEHIQSAERLVTALYRRHRDYDDLMQVARLAAIEALQRAEERAARTYHPTQLRAYVRRGVLHAIYDWLKCAANRPHDQLLSDCASSAANAPARQTGRWPNVVARIPPGEALALDAMAERYAMTRSDVIRGVLVIGLAALAHVADIERQPQDSAAA